MLKADHALPAAVVEVTVGDGESAGAMRTERGSLPAGKLAIALTLARDILAGRGGLFGQVRGMSHDSDSDSDSDIDAPAPPKTETDLAAIAAGPVVVLDDVTSPVPYLPKLRL